MTDTLLQELLDRSFLFDDPTTYRAGVIDAWSAVRTAVTSEDDPGTSGSRTAAV